MFEYHGWATLHLSPGDENERDLDDFAARLASMISQFGDGSGVADLRVVNAKWHVWLAGCPNHRHDSVFGLFPFIAEHAPGSYGLLFVRDDEHAQHDNAFRVWRLSRGQVEELPDPFLSPCVPQIEDPCDPDAG